MKKLSVLFLSSLLVFAACSSESEVDSDVVFEDDTPRFEDEPEVEMEEEESDEEMEAEVEESEEMEDEEMGSEAEGVSVELNVDLSVESEGEVSGEPVLNMEEVAKHSTAADCYSVISGKVYNLTDWVAKHPGGSGAITAICGVDGTATFAGQHGGVEGKFANILSGYYVGDLQ